MSRHAFENELAAAWPPAEWQETTLVLAVSGGGDSAALLRAMAALKSGGRGRLVVAHFNHRLRGGEADLDQEFVVRLGTELELECMVGHADAGATCLGEGLEASARQARYDFLQQTAEKKGARYVVTAHTADDQAETILHHVLRGTGLRGLSGMRRARPLGDAVSLIRPMLGMRRAAAVEYLEALGQPYRSDTMNFDLKFTRSRIRHELLPLLTREYSPDVVQALLRLGSLAGDAEQLIAASASALLDGCVLEENDHSITIDCRRLADQDRHLVREALLGAWRRRSWPLASMGYAQWEKLADLALAPSAVEVRQFVLPGAIIAQRLAERLALKSTA